MCGIAGIVDIFQIQDESARTDYVQKMNASLTHRGPDSDGFYSDQNATLAMRRLSIIDTQGGDQPIFNEDKSITVFFNGEIYNYQILRNKLVQKGHRFSSNSDTEVLVHLYEEYDEEMLGYLKGMFSFCIYDIKRKKIFIARDRFGEKPLFYHYDHKILSFSSEISSLLENPWIGRKINQEALPYFFRTATVPEPYTLLLNVLSLCPGNYLILDESGLSTRSYFRPEIEGEGRLESEDEALEFIRPRLEKAVARQMISDVPIGAFLSGGIDSSTIVALMQRQSDQPVKTFTVKFEDQDYDESAIARKVADHCGTEHHELVVPNYKFEEAMFWEIVDHVGMPFRDTSAIPTFLISREISKHVKVALSGDGGDELFGGYDIFKWYLKIIGTQRLPNFVRGGAASFTDLLQTMPGFKSSSKLRQLSRGLSASMASPHELPVLLSEMFKKAEVEEILRRVPSYEFYLPLVESPNQRSALRDIMYYRLMHVLPVNMLTKVDRMSMANSLEVRTPFLDPDLFAASLEIPDELLIKNGKGKHLLRKLMQDQLPQEVFDHKKAGFSIPLYKYVNATYSTLAKDLLFENNPWPGFFDEEFLRQIYSAGLKMKESNAKKSVFQASHQLWMIMQLLAWARRFKVDVE